jgi:hypothetical protein
VSVVKKKEVEAEKRKKKKKKKIKKKNLEEKFLVCLGFRFGMSSTF